MPEPVTVTVGQALAQALSQAQSTISTGLSRLDAQRLLLHALGRPGSERAWLLAHDQDSLPQADLVCFQALIARHGAGEPMAYLLGEQEFFALSLQVDARVLVPRPDTETLVSWALAQLDRPDMPAKARVLDLGTGSGAIALALKHARSALFVSAIDASPGALAVAAANADRLKLEVSFQLSSWLASVHGSFELIVSNPPYIREADPHLADLGHEPLQALTAGPDGLVDLRRIIDAGPLHLTPGGWLLLEHGHDQAQAVRELLVRRGFHSVRSERDLAGIERCSGGQWPGAANPGQSPR